MQTQANTHGNSNLNSVVKIDELVRRHSAFTSFDDLINAKGNYSPSLNVKHPTLGGELTLIADAYDGHMAGKMDERRAFRY